MFDHKDRLKIIPFNFPQYYYSFRYRRFLFHDIYKNRMISRVFVHSTNLKNYFVSSTFSIRLFHLFSFFIQFRSRFTHLLSRLPPMYDGEERCITALASSLNSYLLNGRIRFTFDSWTEKWYCLLINLERRGVGTKREKEKRRESERERESVWTFTFSSNGIKFLSLMFIYIRNQFFNYTYNRPIVSFRSLIHNLSKIRHFHVLLEIRFLIYYYYFYSDDNNVF